jgi:zinc protease
VRLASVAALIAIASLAHAEQAAQTTLPITVDRLPNGLDVVLAPDPTIASVVVHVRYEGGAGDDRASELGFTSLVDWLAFAGTVHVKRGEYAHQIDATGGFVGSAATLDHLSVWEQVPAGALDLALFLEAERMAGLADGITDAGVAAARDGVNAAYRSAYVEQPYALVAREAQQALWPNGHRNRAELLGDGTLAGATRDRLRTFVRERIRPNRATLVVVGNFDRAQASALVHRYFAWIPGGPRAAARRSSPTPLAQGGETREVADSVPKRVVAYRLPEPFSDEWTALEVLAHARGGEILPQRGGSELRITLVTGAVLPTAPNYDDSAELVRAYQTDMLVRLEGLVYRADALALRSAYGAVPSTIGDLARADVTAAALRAAKDRWLPASAAVNVRGVAR